MSGIFTITQYGQNPLVMDWFGLQDPFTQVLPINIMNNWSGSLWFVASLNSPPAWYSAYSGIAFSGSNAGSVPLTATNQSTYTMTWAVSVSGQIDKSGPNTDSLSLTMVAYSSGFLSGVIASATITFSNILFNRYSGVIKMIGETYNNDQPNIVFTQSFGAGTFVSGQVLSYAASYFLSGWESDIGPQYTVTVGSGVNTIALSWVAAAEAVTQYVVWRWSGATDLPAQTYLSGANGNTLDLMAIVSGTSGAYTDTNAAPLQTGFYRGRTWRPIEPSASTGFSTTHYISSPYSLITSDIVGYNANKNLFLKKHISGQTLVGPWFIEWNYLNAAPQGTMLAISPNAGASGIVIAPNNLVYNLVSTSKWTRYCIFVSGSAINSSGYAWLQQINLPPGSPGAALFIDDVFIVAQS